MTKSRALYDQGRRGTGSACRGPAWPLLLVTDRAGIDELMDIFLHGRPPKPLQIHRPTHSGVAGEPRRMGPLQNLRPRHMEKGECSPGSSKDPRPLPCKLRGEGVNLAVVRPWMVGKRRVEACEKQRPPSLLGVQPLGRSDVLQVAVFVPHDEWQPSTLQPVPPFL